MASVTPFRALRYNPELVPDLSRVVAPPYDVIDEEEQERLYQASPYNVVRLIRGRHEPTDTEAENWYARARRDFDAWRRSQVLRRDGQPAFYVIEHTFAWDGRARSRLGFLGLLGLEEAGQGGVMRHEATLEAPKADRAKLLDAIPANLSPIFCVYPDAGGSIQALLRRQVQRTAPTMSIRIGQEAVRIWALDDPEATRKMQRRMASGKLLIADGHHRFEVAYANRARQGTLMAYFVSLADDALVIRPIHRLVRPPAMPALDVLRGICTLQPAEHLEALRQWLDGHDHRSAGTSQGLGRFGYYGGAQWYRVEVSAERMAEWLRRPSVPAAVARLDVSVLHELVLPIQGVQAQHVTYTAELPTALRTVDTGEAAGVWILRPIPVEEVFAIASQGFTLPPKSTFFFPKVLSGLAFNPFDP